MQDEGIKFRILESDKATYSMEATAYTGGAIKGHRIDSFLNSENECYEWERQNVTLHVLAYPSKW